MKKSTVWAPLAAALLGVIWLAGTMRPMSDASGEMQVAKFGTLAILEDGRFKPIDTYARLNLMAINRKQVYYDEFDNRQQAVKWLLDSLAWGYAQEQAKAPRMDVSDREVLDFFGVVNPRPDGRYLFRELLRDETALAELQAAEKKKPEARTPAERKVLAALQVAQETRSSIKQAVTDHQAEKGSPLKARVFRIDNDQVLHGLNLEMRSGLRYSYSEITGMPDDPKSLSEKARAKAIEQMERFDKFHFAAVKASQLPESKRDLAGNKSMELSTHLRIWEELGMMPEEIRGPGRGPAPGVPLIPPIDGPASGAWLTIRQALTTYEARDNPAAERMERIVAAYATGDKKTFNKEVDAHQKALEASMPTGVMKKVRLEAWFNQFAPFYQCALLYVVVLLLAFGSWVVWHEPLRRAAFALAVVVWVAQSFALGVRMYLTGRPPVIDLYSSAVWIGWGSVLVCLFLEFVTRRNRFANSIGITVAAVLGFSTMIVAHHLGGSGDTMRPLQAVLDTNFWLSTHVTTVTLGYTATFVAGFLALLFVFRMLATAARGYLADRAPITGKDVFYLVASVAGMLALPGILIVALMGGLWLLAYDEPPDGWTLLIFFLVIFAPIALYTVMVSIRRLSEEALAAQQTPPPLLQFADTFALTASAGKALAGMVYGVICFATLLSFVGTVLGGIWADQSWGRFWGWDPKENGALLIVVMNVLILHARWSGLIKERGMCALAILGNMVTAWSWFGTNQLGVGLHAYGFNKTLAFGCAVFWVSQFALAAFALMPIRFWRAYADQPLPASKPASTPPGPRLQGGRSTNVQPAAS